MKLSCWASWPPLLTLLTLLSFPQPSRSRAIEHPCVDHRKNPAYSKSIARDVSCYFVVDRASEMANSRSDGGGYSFDIQKARDMCKKENAILPVLRDEDEEMFLRLHFGMDSAYLALGLTQTVGPASHLKYQWDDGTELTYEDPGWIGKKEKAAFTGLAVDRGRWENVEHDRRFKVPVVIVCVSSPKLLFAGLSIYDLFVREPSFGDDLNRTRRMAAALASLMAPMAPAPAVPGWPMGAVAALLAAEPQPVPAPVDPLAPVDPVAPVVPADSARTSTICHQVDDPKFTNLLVYEQRLCYFVIAETGFKKSAEFSIDKARAACNDLGATLPSVHKKEDHDFLADQFGTAVKEENAKFAVALGLKQTGEDKYEWDDNSKLDYQHAEWTKEKSGALHTVILRNKKWKDVVDPKKEDSEEWTLAICVQPYQPLVIPPIVLPIGPKKGNNCKKPTGTFRKAVLTDDGKICYFVVEKATWAANQKSRTTGLPEFNIAKARSICAEHDGTLPILRHKTEGRWVVERVYDPNDHLVEHPTKPIGKESPIALGVHIKDGNWIGDDGSALTYSGDVWDPTKQPVDYIVMPAHMPEAWVSIDQASSEPTVVICRQEDSGESPQPGTVAVITSTLRPQSPIICDRLEADGFDLVYIYKTEACYFVPAHLKDREFGVEFKLDNAAAECALHGGATLPIVHSQEENEFLVERYIHGSPDFIQNGIALGMVQIKKGEKPEYQWHDKSEMNFRPDEKTWTRVKDKYRYTMITGEKTWTWKDVDDSMAAEFGIRTVTVCKQPYKQPQVPKVPVDPELKPLSGKNCYDESKSKFARTALFQNKVCYFVVHNATRRANRASRTTSGQREFVVETARHICEENGGTLPILGSQEEANFIKTEAFHEKLEHNTDKVPGMQMGDSFVPEAIVLGMRKLSTGALKWDDGTDVAYSPTKWDGKDGATADHTVMIMKPSDIITDEVHWDTRASGENSSIIAVICRQVHVAPPTVATPAATAPAETKGPVETKGPTETKEPPPPPPPPSDSQPPGPTTKNPKINPQGTEGSSAEKIRAFHPAFLAPLIVVMKRLAAWME